MIQLMIMFSSVSDFLNEICDWVSAHLDSFLIGLGGTTLSGIGIGFGIVLLKSLIQNKILKKSTINLSNVATNIFTNLINFKNEINAEILSNLENSKTAIISSIENVNETKEKVKAEIYKRISEGTLSIEDLQTNKEEIVNSITKEISNTIEIVNESVANLKEEIAEEAQEVIEEIAEVIEEENNKEEDIII